MKSLETAKNRREKAAKRQKPVTERTLEVFSHNTGVKERNYERNEDNVILNHIGN